MVVTLTLKMCVREKEEHLHAVVVTLSLSRVNFALTAGTEGGLVVLTDTPVMEWTVR